MVNDWFCRVDDIVGQYIRKNFVEIQCEDCGLDRRAGYRVWISKEAIAIPKSNDGSLQYYGGFEYEKNYRFEYGDWVLYSAESERVEDCIEQYYNTEEENVDARDTEQSY